ncbi:MAG TPA: hypothetical protein VFQ43_06705 [Nitrososphaera sp.]|nr:hypothetical protein [Nitrososphaera sp.]
MGIKCTVINLICLLARKVPPFSYFQLIFLEEIFQVIIVSLAQIQYEPERVYVVRENLFL